MLTRSSLCKKQVDAHDIGFGVSRRRCRVTLPGRFVATATRLILGNNFIYLQKWFDIVRIF